MSATCKAADDVFVLVWFVLSACALLVRCEIRLMKVTDYNSHIAIFSSNAGTTSLVFSLLFFNVRVFFSRAFHTKLSENLIPTQRP